MVSRAHGLVHQAIKKGELEKGDACELCGQSAEKFRIKMTDPVTNQETIRILGRGIVGHHYAGYEGDNALKVWWICYSCNTALAGRHDNSLTKEQAKELIAAKKMARQWAVACQHKKDGRIWYLRFEGTERAARKDYENRVKRNYDSLGIALLNPVKEIVESVGDTSTLFD